MPLSLILQSLHIYDIIFKIYKHTAGFLTLGVDASYRIGLFLIDIRVPDFTIY